MSKSCASCENAKVLPGAKQYRCAANLLRADIRSGGTNRALYSPRDPRYLSQTAYKPRADCKAYKSMD